MNRSGVTVDGIEDPRPGREAPPGGTYVVAGAERRRRKRRDGEGRRQVGGDPAQRFESYYGRPVIKAPVWEAREIAGYLYLGGLAGASSALAAAAQVSGRPQLARGAKLGAAGAMSLGVVALVKDLGRPSRFLNMLRVFKPTSPMSVGSWLVAAYTPAALGAVVADVTGALPVLGAAATAGAAVLGPGVAAYTGVLLADTAVPTWHGAFRELPFLFTASAATAAAGLGLVAAGDGDATPARRLAVVGGAAELLTAALMERRLGELATPLREGRAGRLTRASRILTVAGAAAAVLGGRSAPVRMTAGAALLAASACTRFGVFHAGVASALDPAATIRPQRERRDGARVGSAGRPAG
jgi:DMSO reductase anchor subunit